MSDWIAREAMTFLVLTLTLGGAAARVTGKAIAETWKPTWQLVWYMVLLTAAVRFFHYALFQEPLLSIWRYALTFALLLGLAILGHAQARARQMREQYPWLATEPLRPVKSAD